MRSLIRLLLLSALLLVPLQAAAQTATPIGRVEVALWPEYDQRAMLVIYRIVLPSATPLPTTVAVPVPARIGEPTAVAQQSSDGALVLADYTRAAADGDWATLTIQAESAILQVEYYDTLTMEGASRSYTFTWPSGSPVTDLTYEVMQPVGASEMQIEPAPASDRVGSNGLTYYTGSLGPQDGAVEARLQMAYSKADAGLTVESAPVAEGSGTPAIGAAQPTGLPTTLVTLAPWLIGGLGAALLVAGGVLFIRSRREASGGGRTRHRPRSPSGGEGTIDASSVFCHNCGAQAGVADDFCRKCGTRLRT